MKRLLLSALSSRHQRGYSRVTALILSLCLMCVGIMTIQQVKAHQYSAAKHHVATVKLSVKGCGCGALLSKNHSQKFYQTGTTDVSAETDNYQRAVSLKAGQRLILGVSDPNGRIQPGGAWDTDFGTVDTDGAYTAPSFTPPEGLDRVHYADANGNDVYINVRILPNPSIPNSDKTPTVTFDYMTGNSSAQSSGQSPQAANTEDGPFAPTGKTIVVLPGETPAPPEEILTTTALVGEIVSGASVLVLPARSVVGDTSAIYARPLDETPQQVTLLPNVLPPTGPCTSGSTSVYGPYKTITTRGRTAILADVKVDAGLKADVLKTFGINLSLNATFHVQGQYYDWKRTRLKFVYVCYKRRWVLQDTLICDGLAQSLVTTPAWAILPTGYPRNNEPLLPYTQEGGCHS